MTGIARLSQSAADLAIVGLVAGPPALAGLAFAFAYWQIGNRLSVGLSGGTISLVSRHFGAEDPEQVDLVVKASLIVALVIALPIAVGLWAFAGPLVGLLGGDPEAIGYGAAYLRLSLVAYLALTVLVIVFARPIAKVFVSDLEALRLATPFVRVAAISAVGVGINGSATGILRGAGDTRWPFYATLVGLYVFALSAAWTSVGLSLGIEALYLSLVSETFVPAAITWWRYRGGRWKVVARAGGVGPTSTVEIDD